MIRVRLTPEELLFAAMEGCKRRVSGVTKGRKPRHCAPKNGEWQADIDGAVGEFVLAKWLGIPWDGSPGETDECDVGIYRVRATPYYSGSLLLYPVDHGLFVLVTGNTLDYCIAGWADAVNVKLSEHWAAEGMRQPCFKVPQSALQPAETLPRAEKRETSLF